jgi:hypothetical protein
MIKRFDIVVLKTTENVKWMSGPAGRPALPKGHWIVTALGQKNQAILAKDETLIQIPIDDIIKVSEYDLGKVIKAIKSIKPETVNLGGDEDGQESGRNDRKTK